MLSEIRHVGSLRFPSFSGIRVMMMPFRLDDLDSIPSMLDSWIWTIAKLCRLSPAKSGVAYLTIDERIVPAGRTHRRPGLHVDGIGPDGKRAAYGGGGGFWGKHGMLVAASRVGCRGWTHEFIGEPGPNGDCEHLRGELNSAHEIVMQAGEVYWCGPTAVHESIPMAKDACRQFVRLSMPSDAPWYEGYTRNPTGVEPTGPIHPVRAEFMAYAP